MVVATIIITLSVQLPHYLSFYELLVSGDEEQMTCGLIRCILVAQQIVTASQWNWRRSLQKLLLCKWEL